MNVIAAIRNHVDEHRSGMAVDLAFAVVWVAVVSALFEFLGAPTWAIHLALFGGVVAYFGFFASLKSVRGGE
ncbi:MULTISPECIES: hypothetical protein [Halorussus]|uniref:hypothetical protein n=1 Tax=Halorussus TaxID=1070314 RepID=UPI00209EA91A|nr:hypothetical protein [Halorussus vallis]USZ77714.1 hypothetical protein NGM07_14410 [Halorussus vallis]